MERNKITLEEAEVLMYLKALYEFHDPDCPKDTLDDKILKFDITSSNLDPDDFNSGIDGLCELKILEYNEDGELASTEKGRAIIKALSVLKINDEEFFTKIYNGSVSLVDITKKHFDEILSCVFKLLSM